MLNLDFNETKIDIIYEYENELPVVFFKLIFKNSGKIAEKHNRGCASMLARLLNEGSNDEFFKSLEYRAIELYAKASFEHFQISIKCLKEHFDFALEKLQELFLSVRFEEKILQRLKTLALGELASLNTDYDYQAKRLLNKNVFKDEIFASGLDGTKESIEKISLKELQDFMSENLVLDNALFVFGGDIKEDEVKIKVEKICQILKRNAPNQNKSYKLVDESIEVSEQKSTEQAYIYFCSPFNIQINDEKMYLAKLALFILGQGGFGSRLMEEVRVKRGLAYSAYAMLDVNLNYSRVFGYLQTKNESSNEAKALVKEVFENFVQNGVNEKEFQLAKQFLVGSMPLRYENLAKRLDIMLNEYLHGLKLGNLKEEMQKIKNTNLDELNDFIKAHSEITKVSFASIENES
ncbi:insulinase family protein [Campylobacter sp. IFREMER_LSEM_CL1846]|uniref:M16 family metallopeptidase n=1 Tax=unclassified Campylobacter TaxID=2593542 RepID=UPI00127F213B|nr:MULTISPECIES: pitrilysin family protein [unclassified Campylobacter]EAJ5677971.1 insulinase family protein [Campylobacter lari]EAK0444191.1 insulinase family protein [Campylobacter lari]EAK9942694.1 insulinase family protein [Campylobacter lari]MCV3434198.1 insulinase family protein [Campylobacter sp. IFREMER_LSEM_CL1846]MCV3530798.1 insulinase family protein [Campylobacter sp. CNRCH_2007_0968H]